MGIDVDGGPGGDSAAAINPGTLHALNRRELHKLFSKLMLYENSRR